MPAAPCLPTELWWIGEMDPIKIENEQLRVTVSPSYGARVVSLLDKAVGREWMAQGGYSPNTGEDAQYRAEECVGWDECFPTVSPWDASGTSWGRRLRDHGDVWGREWTVVRSSEIELTLRYDDPQFRFERRLRVDGPHLRADYRLDNLGGTPLPYLWALHALLAVSDRDRIVLDSVDTVSVTHLARDGVSVIKASLPWPGPSADCLEPLDRVQPVQSRFAAKLYATGLAGRHVAVGHGEKWLTIAWDRTIQDLGIWLNYGGWPQPGNIHHIALEPTTAPVDHLGQALDLPGPATLAVGESRSWMATMSVGPREQANESNTHD